jgi:tricorn protease
VAKAPLTQPGVNVKAGEFLLAVNGRPLPANEEIFGLFLGLAAKQVVLKVGPNADGSGAREVTVVPVASEAARRTLPWIEGNRRKVDALSGGRLAYIHVPDTAVPGYTSFKRYFFAQVGKQGAVVDERFNGGGWLTDYIIDYLKRPRLSSSITREGEIVPSPTAAIFGPKAMIINAYAGSGGDAMPWYFRKAAVGPLVGTRTWGGLVGLGGYPALIDRGTVTAPHWAIFGLDGKGEVENVGIAPDLEVEFDQKLVRDGRDPQLEKAVEGVLEALKKSPRPSRRCLCIRLTRPGTRPAISAVRRTASARSGAQKWAGPRPNGTSTRPRVRWPRRLRRGAPGTVVKSTVPLSRCMALIVICPVRQWAMAAASEAYGSRESATLTVLPRTWRVHW